MDALRRRQLDRRAVTSIVSESTGSTDSFEQSIPFSDEVGDKSLRLLFLCCHPVIPLESSIAFALRTVSGFSMEEVASALLISKASAEKRVGRVKEKLREIGLEVAELDNNAIRERMEAVQSTLYLLFTEGYASSTYALTIRRDLCKEAFR